MRVDSRLNQVTGEHIAEGAVGGVAKEVGDEEGDHAPFGIGPAEHFWQRDRALAEAGAHYLVEGEILRRAQSQAQRHHQRHAQRRDEHLGAPFCFGQGRQAVQQAIGDKRREHQQRKVGDFRVPRQHFQHQCRRAEQHPGQHTSSKAEKGCAAQREFDEREQ